MPCKICGQPAGRFFTARVLRRHEVSYFRCSACGFVQTEAPTWLDEAYAAAGNFPDVWAVERARHNREIVGRLIERCFAAGTPVFLDHGAGPGLFVRMMRDAGYDFFRSDPLSLNLFARGFDAADHPALPRFALVTCFEVFEHFVQPVEELRALFARADTVFFSTRLQPAGQELTPAWDYFGFDHGQHVAFHSLTSLQALARVTSSRLYTDGYDHHLLTRADLGLAPADFAAILTGLPAGRVRRRLLRLGEKLVRLARGSPPWRRSLAFADSAAAHPPHSSSTTQ